MAPRAWRRCRAPQDLTSDKGVASAATRGRPGTSLRQGSAAHAPPALSREDEQPGLSWLPCLIST
jgi:hypothetical protein